MGKSMSDVSKGAIITGVFGIIIAIITGWFSLKQTEKSAEIQRQILATGTALVHQVQSGSSTQEILIQTASAPTATALAPVIVTATFPPTERPTNTPSLPSFSDDFENGIKPDWSVVYGDIGMVNGSYTVITPFNGISNNHLAILNGYTWNNLRIKVNLLQLTHGSAYACEFPCGLESAAGIIIRYQPNGESIGFFILANSRIMGLGTLNSDSEWKLITSTLVSDPFAYVGNVGNHEFTIDAIGNTYTVYMNGKKLASASIPGISEGQVGLWLYNSNTDQFPESYAPRYDNFKVEGLP